MSTTIAPTPIKFEDIRRGMRARVVDTVSFTVKQVDSDGFMVSYEGGDVEYLDRTIPPYDRQFFLEPVSVEDREPFTIWQDPETGLFYALDKEGDYLDLNGHGSTYHYTAGPTSKALIERLIPQVVGSDDDDD